MKVLYDRGMSCLSRSFYKTAMKLLKTQLEMLIMVNQLSEMLKMKLQSEFNFSSSKACACRAVWEQKGDLFHCSLQACRVFQKNLYKPVFFFILFLSFFLLFSNRNVLVGLLMKKHSNRSMHSFFLMEVSGVLCACQGSWSPNIAYCQLAAKLLQIICVRNGNWAEALRGFRQKHKHQGNKILGPLNSYFT